MTAYAYDSESASVFVLVRVQIAPAKFVAERGVANLDAESGGFILAMGWSLKAEKAEEVCQPPRGSERRFDRRRLACALIVEELIARFDEIRLRV